MSTPKRIDLPQLVATLGVILSLLFVGYEVRQNTRVNRAAAVQATLEQIIDWQTSAMTDDDWIRIITALNNGTRYADLSPEDRMRYGWVVSSTVRIMENRFRQMQLGVIAPEDLGVGGGKANPNWFQSEHFLDYWTSTNRSRSWTADFLQFFEAEVLELESEERAPVD